MSFHCARRLLFYLDVLWQMSSVLFLSSFTLSSSAFNLVDSLQFRRSASHCLRFRCIFLVLSSTILGFLSLLVFCRSLVYLRPQSLGPLCLSPQFILFYKRLASFNLCKFTYSLCLWAAQDVTVFSLRCQPVLYLAFFSRLQVLPTFLVLCKSPISRTQDLVFFERSLFFSVFGQNSVSVS